MLVGAAVVVSAGGVVWLGAALAAAVSGDRLDGGLAEAIRATVRLPEHVADPRLAWRHPVDQRALPGPIVYWAATLAVVAAVAIVAVVVLRLWRSSRDRGRVRLGVDTRARFATTRDLAPLVVQRPVPSGRFVLGRANGRLVATEDRRAAEEATIGKRRRHSFRQGDRGSVAVIGPSRSGKTVNVIAGLLDWDGPAVVVSVKRDLIDATRSARQRIGETRVFDPSGVSGLPPGGLGRWTPLRAAGTPRGAQKAAVALAASIPRSGVDGGADYWVKQAEILLTGLLGAAALDPDRTMVDVAHWVFTKDIPVKKRPNDIIEILRDAKENGTDGRAGGGGGGDAAARRRLEPRRARPVLGVRNGADRRPGLARPRRRRLRNARRRRPARVRRSRLGRRPGTVEHPVSGRSARRPETARPGARRAARRLEGSGLPT